MFYNHFLATTPRTRRKVAVHESTAGAPIVSRGGKSREELKALGERNGWTARALKMSDIRRASSDEVLWHEAFNKENLEAAFESAKVVCEIRESSKLENTQRMWRGKATEQESERARDMGEEFSRRFPQFERTLENAQKMVRYMETENLDGTKLESYVTAFRALSLEGKLTTTKPQSADDFLADHPELRDTRTPALIAARQQREQRTAEHFAKAANATTEGTVVNVVDYPQEARGVPAQPDKISFRKKIAGMSADQIRRECEINADFRRALDALE